MPETAVQDESQQQQQQQSKEPKYNRFTQQELAAWSPILTPTKVLLIYFGIGVVFVAIGVGCLVATTQVVEVSQRYDDLSQCNPGSDNDERAQELYMNNGSGISCTVNLDISEEMKPPIYIYYQLNNFYQNHRRYVKSRSNQQLKGDSAPTDLDDCDPQQYLDGQKELLIKPCGLIAWSLFNDTYTFFEDGVEVNVNDSDIAWDTDVEKLFADQPSENFNLGDEQFKGLRGGDTLTSTLKNDQRFIVWMRNSALPTFRKLWGQIDQTIDANTTIQIQIENRYNTYLFDGEKRIVMSTTSFIGGKNYFLGIMYVSVGVIAILCGTLYLVLYWMYPRQQGDVYKLSWNKVMVVDQN
eukprot:TRINITY_DN12357_c0_g2_i1.p2 TRINITY_DN12357_c0_g2~~TRINITY_DN12357_c0_g2_i1.p2  ORF type:complete len:354 (-),score=40.24 TRINITY_DN12357_c0_g2_i1:125-1186(-)